MEELPPETAQYIDDLVLQGAARRTVELLAEALARAAWPIWMWGDGEGGYVRLLLEQAFDEQGLRRSEPPPPRPRRRPGPNGALRRHVMERDAYRCQSCGSWVDLSVDHITPASRGGTDDPDNLQTLCRPCNSRKGAR